MSYLPRDQRRAQIVEAAIGLMTRKGLSAATVRAVASEIGCSQGQIHHHFQSASDLRAEAVRVFGDRMSAEYEQAAEGLTGKDRLLALLIGCKDVEDDHIDRLWNEVIAASQMDEIIRGAVSGLLQSWCDEVIVALTDVLALRGVTPRTQVAGVAHRLVGLAIGCELMRNFGLSKRLSSQDLDEIIEMELAIIAQAAASPA